MEPAIQKEITLQEFISSSRSLFRFLLSKWLAIVVISLLAGVIGVAKAWFTKPQYVAEMTFVTETDNASKLGMYAGIASQFGLDLGSSSSGVFEGDNLMELLKSRTMVEKTLLSKIPATNTFLIEHYLDSEMEDWRTKGKTAGVTFEPYPQQRNRQRDSLISSIYKDIVEDKLVVERRDKKTNIISIKLKDGNEIFAQQFTLQLAGNAISYYSEYRSKKSRQNFQIIQRQTDSVKRMLSGNIAEVAAISDLNVNPIRQSVKTGAQRKQVDVQANAALYGELVKNQELARMSLRRETPLIEIVDQPILPLQKIKPGRLLTGIIFSLIGGFLAVAYLALRFLFKTTAQTAGSK